MTPPGGWDSRVIGGTAGVQLYETRPRTEGAVPASAQKASGDPRIEALREREARVEERLLSLPAGSPQHSQVARGLQAAKTRRKKLEREAKKR